MNNSFNRIYRNDHQRGYSKGYSAGYKPTYRHTYRPTYRYGNRSSAVNGSAVFKSIKFLTKVVCSTVVKCCTSVFKVLGSCYDSAKKVRDERKLDKIEKEESIIESKEVEYKSPTFNPEDIIQILEIPATGMAYATETSVELAKRFAFDNGKVLDVGAIDISDDFKNETDDLIDDLFKIKTGHKKRI